MKCWKNREKFKAAFEWNVGDISFEASTVNTEERFAIPRIIPFSGDLQDSALKISRVVKKYLESSKNVSPLNITSLDFQNRSAGALRAVINILSTFIN